MHTPHDLAALIDHLKTERGKRWHHHRQVICQLLPLIAQGTPVTTEQIATTLGLRLDQVSEVLDPLRAYGCEFNTDGHLVGAILTQKPTPHRFRLEGRDLYAWCALDTLFLPALLGHTAEVASTCPITRETITLTISPDTVVTCYLSEVVLSIVTTDCHTPGPQGDFCGRIFFFSSTDSALKWQATRSGSALLSVAEAFALAQAVYVR